VSAAAPASRRARSALAIRSIVRAWLPPGADSGWVAQWLRLQAELRVLYPLARLMPDPVARGAALLAGVIDSATSLGRLSRAELRRTHGWSGPALWRQALQRTLAPYQDLVALAGTKDFGTRAALPPAVSAQLRTGRPLLVVGGHLPFAPPLAAAKALRRRQVEIHSASAPLAMIASEGALVGTHPGIAREQLRNALVERAARAVGSGHPSVHLVRVLARRSTETARSLLTTLEQRGAIVLVTLDRPWTAASAHRRPFIGSGSWGLSTGWARLAIRAGADVVLLTSRSPLLGKSTLEWGAVKSARDFGTPEALVDHYADELERRIGRAPGEYQLSLGTDRHWDPALDAWVAGDADRKRPAGV
jgi:hypothetical protein